MTRRQKKLIHEGGYLAEIEVDVLASDDAWAPYLTVEEVRKLDLVRMAFRVGDVATAARCGKVFSLTQIAV